MSASVALSAAAPNRIRLGRLHWSAVGMAVVFIGSYCAVAWPNWRDNPDLAHGLVTPFASAFLFWQCRGGVSRWLSPGPFRTLLTGAALIGSVLALAVTGLLAASLEWSHSVVNFTLAGSLCLFLGAVLCLLAAAEVRALPLNWVSLTAIGLWLLSAPLPPGAYTRLTLQLQAMVTDFVLQSLHLLGVPASQQGNIIQLAATSVGVEEACSGIRSLLSCAYAGLLFSAWLVHRPARRVVLILMAPLLAIGMNFIRSLTLTLLANSGMSITGFWHDATGYAILGFTSVGLALLAMRLGAPAQGGANATPFAVPDTSDRWQPRLVFLGGCLVALLAGFFIYHSRPVSGPVAPAPDMDVLLPARARGWAVLTPADLQLASPVLNTRHLVEHSYVRGAGEDVVQLTVYVAYWAPGQTPVSRVAAHTPDACWPGSGWAPLAQPYPQQNLPLGERTLPLAEHRLFRSAGSLTEHVWFWHIYDGRVINYRDPYSVPALLEIALRYGFRRQGAQYFVRVSSNQSWEKLAPEPLLREIFAKLQPLGL